MCFDATAGTRYTNGGCILSWKVTLQGTDVSARAFLLSLVAEC